MQIDAGVASPTCSDCERPVWARGLCHRHHTRQWRRGELTPVPAPSLRERLFSRLIIDPATGCLVWTGAIGGAGYGHVWAEGRTQPVHRVMWEMFAGPVPAGMKLDHLCRNRACASVAHLEPVSNKVNILRGVSPSAVHARKTHCPAGHPYDETNTWVDANGWRHCRACKRRPAAPD